MATVGDDALQLGDFDRIESTGDPAGYVEWMDRQRRGYRDKGIDALALDGSEHVLDLGCGPGNDLVIFATQSRFALGIDLSTTMAATARSRATDASAMVADGQRLPIADAVFDAAWARAVMVHTPRPEAAVGELARVLKPGGRLVLSEPDQGSHIVATSLPDVFERIKQHRQTKFRHPLVGRRLRDLVVGAGLAVVKTWATPLVHTSLASARAAGGPFDRAIADAVADDAISQDDADGYVASLVEADERGSFFFAALAVSVAAVKPART